jgi:riboflavin kinase/FMN adenylyltransferase
MKVVTDPAALAAERRPVVLAAGFFDGVHRGHQRVLRRAMRRARELGGHAWAMTFDTHPMKVLRPAAAPRLLTSTGHKLLLFDRLGLDGCILLPFTRELAATEAGDFLRWLRLCAPSLREIHVGRNWRFGRGAAGDVDLLRQFGRGAGFGVRLAPTSRCGGRAVSSTRVREEILAGRLEAARAMLGRPFSVLGTVVPGRRVGRQLGYPTANLEPHNEVLPPCGVYAVFARVGRRLIQGVANYGTCPTFRGAVTGRPVLELHLLDFEGNIYGRQVEIFFARRLRPEKTYRRVAELQRQIGRDVASARRILSREKIKQSLYSKEHRRYSPAQQQQRGTT